MTFPEKLYDLRTRRHASQEQVAQAVLVTRRSVSAWELGRKLPNYDSIIALACYFGVTTDYLLGLADEESRAGGRQPAGRSRKTS